MKKPLIAVLVVLAVATAACGGTDASDDTIAPEAGGAEIAIEGFAFGPDTITVAPGTTVTWSNAEDAIPHTTTSDDGVWDSGTLEPGDEFSFTFDEPGTYTYFCAVHPSMTATIVVEG